MIVMRWAMVVVGLVGSVCVAQEEPRSNQTPYWSALAEDRTEDPLVVAIIWVGILLWLICIAKTATRYFRWIVSKTDLVIRDARRQTFAASARTMRRLACVSVVAGFISVLQILRTTTRYSAQGAIPLKPAEEVILLNRCVELFFPFFVAFAVAWVLSWIIQAMAKKRSTTT